MGWIQAMELIPEPRTGAYPHDWYNVGPPVDSVQLVQITPITIWFMVLITSYNYSYGIL